MKTRDRARAMESAAIEKIMEEYPLHYWTFKGKRNKLDELLNGLMDGQLMVCYNKDGIDYLDKQFTKPIAEIDDQGRPIRRKDRNGQLMVQYLGTGEVIKDEDYKELSGEEAKEDETDEEEEEEEDDEDEDRDELENESDPPKSNKDNKTSLEEQNPSDPDWKTGAGHGESNKPFELNSSKKISLNDDVDKRSKKDKVGAEAKGPKALPPVDLIEKKDNRGRTALMLAVTMGYRDCTRALLKHNADVFATDRNGFNVYHEAITTKDTGLIQIVTRGMERCRIESILKYIRDNFDDKILNIPNFYVEIKWKVKGFKIFGFSDQVRIYKKDNKVRVDNTILDIRGVGVLIPEMIYVTRTMIFIKLDDESQFYDVNHDTKSYSEHIYEYEVKHRKNNKYAKEDIRNPNREFAIDSEDIHKRLKLMVELIEIVAKRMRVRPLYRLLQNSKQKTSYVDGFKCDIYQIKGLKQKVASRKEHLNRAFKDPRLMLKARRQNINSPLDYFCPSGKYKDLDIGLKPKMKYREDHFKTIVYMCDKFALNYQCQILPIFELLGQVRGPLRYLNDVVKLTLPKGFPIKIELEQGNKKSSCQFLNPNGLSSRVNWVTNVDGGCTLIDDKAFEIPTGYSPNKLK